MRASTKTVRLLAWSVTALILAGIAGGAVIQWRASKTFDKAEQEWTAFAETAGHKTHLLNNLRRELGFVGFIHAYKNFVLRGNAEYAEQARKHGKAALGLLDDYGALGLSDDEVAAMKNLRSTVATHLEIVQATENLMSLGQTGQQVDKAIRIDDTAAAAALGVLDDAWLQARAAAQQAMSETLAESRQQLHVHVYAVPLGVLTGVLILWLVARLVREADVRNRAITDLRAANEAKSLFLANVSHELRTPLNAVLGFTDLIRREAYGSIGHPKYHAYLDDIYLSAEHLLELINGLLDMTRAEAGALRLRNTDLDVAELINSSLRLLNAGSLRVDVDVPVNTPKLRGDSLRLRQSLLNILANAKKFSPVGSTISVATRIEDDGGIAIQVRDEGIGMSHDDMVRVMEPFTQTEAVYARQFDGLGLGLPLTKRFVEAHGGTLALESDPGKGTTAILIFPPERSIALASDAA